MNARNGHETCHHRIYRLTCDEYDELRARAGGCCERCRTPAKETTRGILVIDHARRHYDPDNAVRGLLCDRCNQHLWLVEAGKRTMDDATRRYLADPWYRRYEAARRSGVRQFRNRRRVFA